jgi:ABC-type glycerol-3-phosphate transport system substrate-binding protein
MSEHLNLNKTRKMKKVIFALVIATSLVACGGNASTEATTDSTAVAADTTAATVDTTATPAADTTIAK